MKLESVIATEKKIEEILSSKESEIKEIETALADAKKAEEAARQNMTNASTNRDPKGYRKAKSALSEALDTQEMEQTRLDVLRGHKPLISEEEYKKVSGEIFGELAIKEEEAKKQLIEMAKKMYEIGQEYAETQEEANAVLLRWQRDIYRNADRKPSDPFNKTQLKASNYDIEQLGYSAMSSHAYFNLTGEWFCDKVGTTQYKQILHEIPMSFQSLYY